VQTNLVALRDFLCRRGVTCAVVNLTRYRHAEEHGVHYPRSGVGVIRLLLRQRYDVIHLHIGGDLSTRLVSLGLVCSALPWAKTVLTFHSGGYPGSPEGRKTGPLTFRAFALRRFDRNIAVNEELADFFRRVGCDAKRVRLIPPHAVPAASFADLTTTHLPAEIEHFMSAHKRVIVSVSGLEPEYDIPLQLETLAVVRERYPDAGLLVIGSGSLMNELGAAAARKSYGEHILLAGDLPHAVTLSAVARSDVFLRTTHYDGDAISVREALWLGTPAIVTDNGMRPAGVQLVPIGDSAAVAAAIIRQLARSRKATTSSPPMEALGEENLESTLRLYREMLQ